MTPTGEVKTGIVTKYDETTMTAVIQDSEGIMHNVVCLFDRYDPKTGAYSFRAPSEESPCLYTTIGETTYLLGLFPPLNMTPEGIHPKNSSCNNTENRTPQGMLESIVKPGNVIDTNSNGSKENFTDSEKNIILASGKLESLWNLINFVWKNTCQMFKLYSGPMDVTAEVTDKEECNTTIKWRKTLEERKDGVKHTLLDLRIGKDAGVVELQVNGSTLLHIYENKDILLIANDIKINAKKIEYNADEVNMLNVGVVRLP